MRLAQNRLEGTIPVAIFERLSNISKWQLMLIRPAQSDNETVIPVDNLAEFRWQRRLRFDSLCLAIERVSLQQSHRSSLSLFPFCFAFQEVIVLAANDFDPHPIPTEIGLLTSLCEWTRNGWMNACWGTFRTVLLIRLALSNPDPDSNSLPSHARTPTHAFYWSLNSLRPNRDRQCT